jgi:trans-2,3-dihydro-3-hydroxyanthranilate isomerase
MRTIPIELYDAFSDRVFGGNRAGVVIEPERLAEGEMRAIAAELAAPATCFVHRRGETAFEARFFTPTQELVMCGHGVVALFTALTREGRSLAAAGAAPLAVDLETVSGAIAVDVHASHGASPLVMMTVPDPVFSKTASDREELAAALGLELDALAARPEPAIVATSTRHLFIPVGSLADMRAMKPNFERLTALSRANDVVTVNAFTLETVHEGSTVHGRDFCPAVGTPEAAASGTTNSALGAYLVANHLVETREEAVAIVGEQGFEMGRPSRIHTEIALRGGSIARIKVGGRATRSLEGRLSLP